MERKQFLKSLGAGAAFAITFPCLGGCSKDGDEIDGDIVKQPTGIDFTIDLDSAEAANLANDGGFILKNLVVVAKNLEGEFVAATQVCSHQQYDQVRFVSEQGGIFYCDVHGSRFGQDGAPLNSISNSTPKPIRIYNIEQEGRMLRIFE
ncbi:ubiquinol-cytochrome c reductase iron-sulfur subunit [Maribacter sp. 2210JD10-5]|uniref:QcrA and Rieske domain-containing protein n=1 Tax=Maribacter sp. 2210JD10-5 TaxID=3386272 RepID=UPI0039BCB30D